MKPTKRHTDPLGRSPLVSRYRLLALCLVVAIIGSAWPIWPRSIEAAFDIDAVPLNRQDAFQHQGHRDEVLRPFAQVGMDVNGTFRRIDRLST